MYVQLEGSPPIFRQNSSCFVLLHNYTYLQGYNTFYGHWNSIGYNPNSLATTIGLSVDFFSFSYSDVSFH